MTDRQEALFSSLFALVLMNITDGWISAAWWFVWAATFAWYLVCTHVERKKARR